MIRLPIQNSEEDDTPQEWSLLELNGELLTPRNEPEGDSIEVGKVHFDAEVRYVTLRYVTLRYVTLRYVEWMDGWMDGWMD